VHRLQLLKEKYERQAVTIYHLFLSAQALLGDVTKSSPEWNEDPTHTPSSKPNLPIRGRVLRYLPSVQGQKVMPLRAVNLRCSVCSHRVLLRKLHLLSMYVRCTRSTARQWDPAFAQKRSSPPERQGGEFPPGEERVAAVKTTSRVRRKKICTTSCLRDESNAEVSAERSIYAIVSCRVRALHLCPVYL